MADFGVNAGDTNVTIYVRLRDSTTGLAKTGLVFNSAGVVCSYVLPAAARAAIVLVTQTVTGAHSDGGFVEVDATNCKGLYRLDLPDAAVASGAFTLISIEFDGIIEETVEIPLGPRDSNLTQIGGVAQSATDLKDFADAGYDPATSKVQGVVLVDTTTTNTDMVGTDSAALASVCTEARLAELDAANLPADVDAILVDTGTTLEAHMTDIKGTAFVKDTHSLINIEGYVDLIDDGTSGLAKIATDVAAALVDTNSLNDTKIPQTLNLTALGNIGIDWANIENPTSIVDLSATDIQLCDTVTTYTGNTVQTGDSFARIGAAGASLTDLGGMSTAMKAEVLSEVNSALDTAISELGVAAPSSTPTIRTALMLLYMALRNKTVVQTSGTDALEIYNNAGTKIAAKLLTDDGSDYTEAQMA